MLRAPRGKKASLAAGQKRKGEKIRGALQYHSKSYVASQSYLEVEPNSMAD